MHLHVAGWSGCNVPPSGLTLRGGRGVKIEKFFREEFCLGKLMLDIQYHALGCAE